MEMFVGYSWQRDDAADAWMDGMVARFVWCVRRGDKHRIRGSGEDGDRRARKDLGLETPYCGFSANGQATDAKALSKHLRTDGQACRTSNNPVGAGYCQEFITSRTISTPIKVAIRTKVYNASSHPQSVPLKGMA